MEKVKPMIKPSRVSVAVWMIPKSAEVSVSLVRYLLRMALPNHTEPERAAAEMVNTNSGELAKYEILKSSWIQNIFSHILNVTVSCKRHCDIQFIVNNFEAFGNTSFAHGT